MMPPGPAVPTLLDQLRQSLGSDDTFLWRKRLLTERLMRNITEKHERALLYLRDLIKAGDDQPSHSELAGGAFYQHLGDQGRAQARPGPRTDRVGSPIRLARCWQPPSTCQPLPALHAGPSSTAET